MSNSLHITNPLIERLCTLRNIILLSHFVKTKFIDSKNPFLLITTFPVFLFIINFLYLPSIFKDENQLTIWEPIFNFFFSF